jgi:guanylate kinase
MKTTAQNKHLLTHLPAFEKILEHYKPSDKSIDILQKTPIVLLVGPTAAGRNTLINILTGTGRYHYIASDTTRAPRANNGIMEQNGREYWFKTEEEVLQGLTDGEYIEAALIHRQQVSGANIHGLKLANSTGKIAITELTPEGGTAYHDMKPTGLFIFLLPPSFNIWMQRLRARGEMPEAEVRRRLESAQEEIAEALRSDFYQFVINNEVHEAAMAVDELANGRVVDQEKQVMGRNHAEQLAIDVQLYLAS